MHSRKSGWNSPAPFVASLLGIAAWIALALSKISGSGGLARSLLLAAAFCVPFLALGLIAIHVLKGKARRVATLTGSRAFLVLGNVDNGLDQLRTVDGYAISFMPVVTLRDGAFEIWRAAEQEHPIVSIPLAALTVTLGRHWAVYPHAAMIMTVAGIEKPIAISLFGDGRWSLLPMGRCALTETVRELGVTPVD